MKRINQAVRKQTEKGLGVVPGQVAAGPEGKGKKLRSAALTLLILRLLAIAPMRQTLQRERETVLHMAQGAMPPKLRMWP